MTSWLDKLFARSSKSTHRPVRERRKAAQSRNVDTGSDLSLVDDSPGKHRGFDPYNSGSFRRTNAWERVIRR
jgi:hypothetical protein